jgi:hypothetical protein
MSFVIRWILLLISTMTSLSLSPLNSYRPFNSSISTFFCNCILASIIYFVSNMSFYNLHMLYNTMQIDASLAIDHNGTFVCYIMIFQPPFKMPNVLPHICRWNFVWNFKSLCKALIHFHNLVFYDPHSTPRVHNVFFVLSFCNDIATLVSIQIHFLILHVCYFAKMDLIFLQSNQNVTQETHVLCLNIFLIQKLDNNLSIKLDCIVNAHLMHFFTFTISK